MMKCTNCGKQNPKTAKFCASCGHELEAACPKCGAPLLASAKFCAECGQALDEKAGAVTKKRAAPQKKSAPPASVAGAQPDEGEIAPVVKKKPIWMWLGLGFFGLLIVAGTALAFFYEIDIDLLGAAPTETPSPTETARPEPTQPDFLQSFESDSALAEPVAAAPPCQILFGSTRDEQANIFILGADGVETQLTAGESYNVQPAWSPDREQIVFVSGRDGVDQIYVMDADGRNQRRLTNTVTSESAPAWSPDGTKIAFVSTRDDPPQIYVMDADGGNQRRLTAPNGENWQPAWSPDGGQIAFSSNRDNTWEIYMIGVDGNNERRLTVSDSPDVFPAWSPDGKQIVFNSKRSGNFEIHIMDADGGNVRQLTSFQDVCFEPAWSPDGEHILYISNHDGQYEIYSVDVNGENRQQFTSSGWDDNATPKWLPGCSGLPQTAPAAQIAQEPAPATAPTPGPLMPPPGGLEIPPDAAGLILNLDLDRDRFHCIRADGPATLTITADVTDQDRGLALFWRLVEKNSGWTLDWENVSLQRAGTNQRKYTFNADVTAGTNNFGYPPGMGEAWFQFQIVTGDRAIRTPVYRDAVTFFPCAQ